MLPSLRRVLPRLLALAAIGGAISGCTMTGVASPSSAYAHSGQGLQYPGEPGYNAP